MIRIDLGTMMEEIIQDIGYSEIRRVFSDDIEEEIKEAYEKGVSDGEGRAQTK